MKALDELSFCRFTLRLAEFGDPVWIDLPREGKAKPSPPVEAGRTPVAGSKSEAMRRLFEQGVSVADTARTIGVPYQFAYQVHQRWKGKA
ncbi:MAG: hypothetical protein HY262_05970 [Chloroflexi bacterium]|nr:hypothetical protein [Chloroflexota bacterium]